MCCDKFELKAALTSIGVLGQITMYNVKEAAYSNGLSENELFCFQ